jgi:hypothetical protein
MPYGIGAASQYQQAGSYVGRSLRGDKAADLSMQQPAKFGLVISRDCRSVGTAEALGVDVPVHLQQLADGANE